MGNACLGYATFLEFKTNKKKVTKKKYLESYDNLIDDLSTSDNPQPYALEDTKYITYDFGNCDLCRKKNIPVQKHSEYFICRECDYKCHTELYI